MTKHNFYIITGGPGGGKTTLLEALATKGFPYVPETARQIIKDRLSKGLSPRPNPLDFAKEIFSQDLLNFQLNLDKTSPLFFDRSFLDSACMIFDSDVTEFEKIKPLLASHTYNSKVFITPPWLEIYQPDSERDQTFDDAIRIYERLGDWYNEHGYELLALPMHSIEKRIEFVINAIAI